MPIKRHNSLFDGILRGVFSFYIHMAVPWHVARTGQGPSLGQSVSQVPVQQSRSGRMNNNNMIMTKTHIDRFQIHLVTIPQKSVSSSSPGLVQSVSQITSPGHIDLSYAMSVRRRSVTSKGQDGGANARRRSVPPTAHNLGSSAHGKLFSKHLLLLAKETNPTDKNGQISPISEFLLGAIIYCLVPYNNKNQEVFGFPSSAVGTN